MTREPSRLWAVPVAAMLILAFLSLAMRGVHGQDLTYDENTYFGAGERILETGAWQGRAALLHPPLSYYVAGLPLLWLADGVAARDGATVLLCRATSLLAFGVPLLIGVFAWARELYGPAAAVVALALAAFSPTLLAHAPLLTPDLALTSSGFLATYLSWRHWRAPGPGSLFAWGLVLGLALLAKLSALLLLIAAALLGLATLAARRSVRGAGALLAALATAWLVLNLGYAFEGFFDVADKAALVGRAPEGSLVRAVAGAAAPLVPLPYLRAAATQWGVGERGVPAFLMGELSHTGWWHYFLVAVLIKETLPFLALLLLGAALTKWTHAGWLDELWLLVPPALFFGFFSFLGTVDIGIRYVMPAFPFLMVFASKAVRLPGRSGRIAIVASSGLLTWHAIVAVRACPDFLAYFNELVGGPRNGYRYLVDSNLDWGQNRSRMEAVAREQGFQVRPEILPASGRVAVDANRLQGILDRQRYRLLREEYDPVGHVGYNWLVFDLDRNRRFPADSIRPVLSGDGWRAASVAERGWPGVEFDDSGWEPVRVVLAEEQAEFVASREYPGTEASLMTCAASDDLCHFRKVFVLGAPALQAILHLATKDRYELHVNGRPLASRETCPGGWPQEEHRLTEHLRPGRNAVAVRTRACGARPAGVFLEMRVAQRAPDADPPRVR